MKKWLAIIFLILIFGCIAGVFWYTEWVYSLPTPVPVDYVSVSHRERIDIRNKFTVEKDGPVLLHFFNPDCPCSKFNIPHFRSLVKTYGDQMNFAVVAMTVDKSYTADIIRRKLGVEVPVLFDDSLAVACGVYSTPQAVLLDKNNLLYYRGNYNKNRYCADKKSNYAQIAIDSLLANKPSPVFSAFALRAYGCSLPNCNQQSSIK